MSDKIEEIRARHKDATWRYYELPSQMHDDRAFLLAEVEWLRVQIERMTCDRKNIVAEVEKLRWDTQLLHRSNETLVAKNERLHNALYRIAGRWPYADDPWLIAREALAR